MAYIENGFRGCLLPENISKRNLALIEALCYQANTAQNSWAGFARYLNEFLIPCVIATNYIWDIEKLRVLTTPPLESWQAYLKLWQFNLELSNRGLTGSLKAMNQYGGMEIKRSIDAVFNTIS